MLVTRPEPGASETAARLRARGLVPHLAPFLEVRPLPARLPLPDRVQAVLAASGNAVAGLPETHRALPLLAVGDATAERARRAGFSDVRSADGDAQALAALVARRCDPRAGPLLLAAGRGQSGALAENLRGRGFRVVRRAVYESAPVRAFPDPAAAALAGGGLRAALFFSAETARAFVRTFPYALRPALAGTEALAIGAAAGIALEPLPWRRVRVALRPTQDELLALI